MLQIFRSDPKYLRTVHTPCLLPENSHALHASLSVLFAYILPLIQHFSISLGSDFVPLVTPGLDGIAIFSFFLFYSGVGRENTVAGGLNQHMLFNKIFLSLKKYDTLLL